MGIELARALAKPVVTIQALVHGIPWNRIGEKLCLLESRMLKGIFERETFILCISPMPLPVKVKLEPSQRKQLFAQFNLPAQNTQQERAFFRLRPYHRQKTGSRPIPVVKSCRARVVLRRETAWEYLVL